MTKAEIEDFYRRIIRKAHRDSTREDVFVVDIPDIENVFANVHAGFPVEEDD
jgi:hypothetical protein